jgi:hypothetical protein
MAVKSNGRQRPALSGNPKNRYYPPQVCGSSGESRFGGQSQMRQAIIVGLALWSLTGTVQAGSDTFTQIGTWSCCGPVTFPEQFASPPTVIVTVCVGTVDTGTACFTEQIKKVTATGFDPMGNVSPAKGWGIGFNGTWIAVGPPNLPGTVTPSYLVLTIVYAPPGTNNGGGSKSNVEYAAGSTTGTTTTASQSFKFGNTVSAEGSGGVAGNTTGGGVSFSFSRSITDTQSLDIKKTINSKIDVPGPGHCSGPGSLNRFSASLSGVSAGG